MRPDDEERFAAFVRERGDHFLRLAVLLAGDLPSAEDLLQASLVKLYRRGRGSTFLRPRPTRTCGRSS